MPSSAGIYQAHTKVRTFWTDHAAGGVVARERELRGLSQEGLANAIKRFAVDEGWFKVHGAVDAFTIRRIERDGHVPSERVRLVIALFFDTEPRAIWEPQNRRLSQERLA